MAATGKVKPVAVVWSLTSRRWKRARLRLCGCDAHYCRKQRRLRRANHRAWLLHQKAVTSVIIGAKRVDQLDDNIAATGIRLSEDELKQLDAVSALPREYPGWMLERQGNIVVISSHSNNSFPGGASFAGAFFPLCSQNSILLFDRFYSSYD